MILYGMVLLKGINKYQLRATFNLLFVRRID